MHESPNCGSVYDVESTHWRPLVPLGESSLPPAPVSQAPHVSAHLASTIGYLSHRDFKSWHVAGFPPIVMRVLVQSSQPGAAADSGDGAGSGTGAGVGAGGGGVGGGAGGVGAASVPSPLKPPQLPQLFMHRCLAEGYEAHRSPYPPVLACEHGM